MELRNDLSGWENTLIEFNGEGAIELLKKQTILYRSGIYKIQSIIHPDRMYIGSAVRISYRKSEHFRKLRSGRHANKKLQAHYDKYGEDDLKFSVLELMPSHQMIEHEQKYLDSIKPTFNICTIARNTMGRKQSIETRRKRSASLKGRRPNDETRQKMSQAAIRKYQLIKNGK